MQHVYDRKAPKQATNLSNNRDLLKVVPLDCGSQAKRAAWLNDNAAAIDSYNSFAAENGAFSDGNRSF